MVIQSIVANSLSNHLILYPKRQLIAEKRVQNDTKLFCAHANLKLMGVSILSADRSTDFKKTMFAVFCGGLDAVQHMNKFARAPKRSPKLNTAVDPAESEMNGLLQQMTLGLLRFRTLNGPG